MPSAFACGQEVACGRVERHIAIAEKKRYFVGEDEVFGHAADDFPGVGNYPEAVAQRHRLLYVVRGNQDCASFVAGKVVEELQHFDAACHVEKCRGFVEDYDGRFLRQCFGYHYLLSLAVAEFGYVRFRLVAYSDFLDSRGNDLAVVLVEPSQKSGVGMPTEPDEFARGLMALGVEKGAKVGIWANNIPDWMTVFFACAKIGAWLVTVNTNYKVGELEYLLADADIHTLCMISQYRDSSYVDMVYELVPELRDLPKGGQLHSERLPLLRKWVFPTPQRCASSATADA